MNLKKHIESLLKETKYCDENHNIFINKLLKAIEKIDVDLVEILIKDEKAKKHFFSKVLDTYVMNQFKLIDFFSMNNYFEESYTSYTNKIGLIRKDDFIKKNNDVVLAFPYKDCVLEGGQTKEDQKGKENFFNEILDSDEIDRLFEPKLLTNIKRYSKDGIEENPTISDKDNLILKGNNLLALHSLKKKYAGKIKLIYIDPPYFFRKTTKNNDSFVYNSNFKLSTWLTFMKNRLLAAKELLKDDGLLFISIDDDGQAYLKILLDEIFGVENFISTLPTIMNLKGNNDEFGFSGTHEYTLAVAKDIEQASILEYKVDEDEIFNKWKFDEYGIYKEADNLRATGANAPREKRPNLFYPIFYNKQKEYFYISDKDVPTNKNDIKILPISPNGDELSWYWGKETFNQKKYNLILKLTGNGYQFYRKQRPKLGEIPTKKPKSILYKPEYSSSNATNQLRELFDNKVFNNPKPLNLIKDIIEISTNKNDIILDFFSGSGTTGHAVLDLNKEDGGNRKFIMVEQMDYIETITVPRIVKVMERDNIDDSFVYAELKQVSNFDKSNSRLKQEMRYLPIGELEDEDYNISKEEIAINKAFYGVDDE